MADLIVGPGSAGVTRRNGVPETEQEAAGRLYSLLVDFAEGCPLGELRDSTERAAGALARGWDVDPATRHSAELLVLDGGRS